MVCFSHCVVNVLLLTRVVVNVLLLFCCQKEALPDDYAHRDPEHKHIYRFVRNLFTAAQLTAECAIVTLVRASASDVYRAGLVRSSALAMCTVQV